MSEALIREEFEALCAAHFDEHEGLILRDGAWTPKALAEWKAQLPHNPSEIEAAINHVHLRVLFWQPATLDVDEVRKIGTRIRDAWTDTLREGFPDRQFRVLFHDQIDEEGFMDDFQVTAFQVHA